MRAFKLETLAVLMLPGVALANGGDLHIGALSTGVPVVVVYAVGGFVGAVVLFFLANWARYRRSQNRGASSPGRRKSRRQEEEDDPTGRKGN